MRERERQKEREREREINVFIERLPAVGRHHFEHFSYNLYVFFSVGGAPFLMMRDLVASFFKGGYLPPQRSAPPHPTKLEPICGAHRNVITVL